MAPVYELGSFRLDTEAKLLLREDTPVALGPRAVSVLQALVVRAGSPVSKDDLFRAAWPGLAVEDSNLTVQVAALRRADARRPQVLERSCRGRTGVHFRSRLREDRGDQQQRILVVVDHVHADSM